MQINEALWDFPVDYCLKVMGRMDSDLAEQLVTILQRYIKDFDPKSLSVRPSSKGRYQSLTASIYLTDKRQVEGIYADLNQCKDVLWAL